MNIRSFRPVRTVRFGVFEVNLDAQELRKQGVRVRVQQQPFQILALLLERPGAAVSRDELRRRLWPAGTFVDFEHSLNAAIKRLRSVLGDAADNPRFVETLHKRGYRFIAPVEAVGDGHIAGTAVPAVSGTLPTTETRLRLAVLPFLNLSGDAEQEYFSDGLTEEMIARLGRIHPERLGVIARTSAERFRHAGCPIDEIGRELRATYVVEGSVRRSGDQIRIHVQLIDARDQTHLWSETYDRRLEDFFVIQSDIADRVARALAVELLPHSRSDAHEGRPSTVEAYQAYLKGRFHWARGALLGSRQAMESTRKAIGYYEQAVALDPSFARAHASLARAKSWIVEYSDKPAQEVLEEARRSASHAIALDPSLH